MKRYYTEPELDIRLFGCGDGIHAEGTGATDTTLISGYTAGMYNQAQMYNSIQGRSYVATVKVMNVIKFNE